MDHGLSVTYYVAVVATPGELMCRQKAQQAQFIRNSSSHHHRRRRRHGRCTKSSEAK